MINIVTDKKEIEKLHQQLLLKLKANFQERIECYVGFPGGGFPDEVGYSPELDLWVSAGHPGKTHWHAFGLGRPRDGRSNAIIGEINFPHDGINRSFAGAFGIEDNEKILILHRGKIGGGKQGVGKSLFVKNFRGDRISTWDGDRETELYLVGELNSPQLANQIDTFIREIVRIKGIPQNSDHFNTDELENYQYTKEPHGKSKVERKGSRTINRVHGLIVDALANELENRGYKIGNDNHRDLFIHDNGKISALFEVKTNSGTQSLYSATGQLLIYSIPITNKVELIAVLPDELNSTVEKRLNELGIKVLYYSWENEEPEFFQLDKLL